MVFVIEKSLHNIVHPFFQMYLRTWACELGVPILSIDYSLAPDAPFPRALEECFFVYAWCLNNFHQLGTTGKCFCLAGDSAGQDCNQYLTPLSLVYILVSVDSVDSTSMFVICKGIYPSLQVKKREWNKMPIEIKKRGETGPKRLNTLLVYYFSCSRVTLAYGSCINATQINAN